MIITLTKDTPQRREELAAAVDEERDRRAAVGFVFNGATFQARPQDLTNMAGAGVMATSAISSDEGLRDSLRWASPDVDFAWIDVSNNAVPMTAQTMIDFGAAAMTFVQRLYFKGLAIKTAIRSGNAPADYKADALW